LTIDSRSSSSEEVVINEDVFEDVEYEDAEDEDDGRRKRRRSRILSMSELVGMMVQLGP
jgi:hypothetical protein